LKIRRMIVCLSLFFGMSVCPAGASIVTISPSGSTGAGGSITFSEIGSQDTNSANVNTDFSSSGMIAIVFTVSDSSPVAIYGNDVNDTLSTWDAFTATIVSGSASFYDLNDPYGFNSTYGTYALPADWSVSLINGGNTAVFTGGSVVPGDSIFTSLGFVVTDPSQPVTVELSAIVPEPTSIVPASLAVVILGLARCRRQWRRRRTTFALAAAAALVLMPAQSPGAGPQVVAAYQKNFTIEQVGTVAGHPTQMAFGPSGLVYVMTADAGPVSYTYNPATGALTQSANAAPNVVGIGIAFHGTDMYLTSTDGTIHKLQDTNQNGVWGEHGELDVAIVTGIPQGDHNTDQLQIVGNTMYVGIGRRTINGHFGAWTSGTIDDLGGKGFFAGGTGRTWGDSAYNGTIAWIQDLTQVVNITGSANAFTTEPPTFSQHLIQHDAGPFMTVSPGKLVVHSAGTRNPFGLCLDADGNLWFTNNFNRTATLGNGQAGFGLRGDLLDSDFSRDVQDQIFQASHGADYGYTDDNWRGVNPMLTPNHAGYHRVTGVTFDNLFNRGPYTLHDPANPDGLGPSSSSDGCAFSYSPNLPFALHGNIFIVRYNGSITEAPGGAGKTLTYADLVAVNVQTGKVQRVASGFTNPLALLADDQSGRLLIADYGAKAIYALQYLP
jgi:glucose/arabinose dehydrogenase